MSLDSFAALILTHGRPDKVYTYTSLRRAGYTGRVVVVIDNEDERADEYRELFGELVYVFDKRAAAATTDTGGNFNDFRAVVFARNASFDIARELGLRYFIQLDDDYTEFRHKSDGEGRYINRRRINDLDAVLRAMVEYFKSIPALSIAMEQGGDFPGGVHHKMPLMARRKAMNTFVCSVDRPFRFSGLVNEDVTAYVTLGARGGLFLTIPFVGIQQPATQSSSGGLTEIYLDSGTYVKSFYTVMYQPSSVKVSVIHSTSPRIHHKVSWRYTVPKILRAEHQRGQTLGR